MTLEKQLFAGIKDDWFDFIDSQKDQPYFIELLSNLENEVNNYTIYPSIEDMLKPLKLCSLSNVKVVIIGQDPYHTPGVADGLAFSSQLTKIPPSLKNIFKEITSDVGITNTSPNLSNWSKQGVLLLNTILSVRESSAKSHKNLGWHTFVVELIKYLDGFDSLIFVLWGNDAIKYETYLKQSYIITGYHPSPLAQGKFFNGKYFSKINEYLIKQNKNTIDWSTNDV